MYSSYFRNKFLSLDAFQLKEIATITMLIDHIGFMLIYNGMLYGYNSELFNIVRFEEQGAKLYVLYRMCRIIGRIAFPIFAFLLVEGYYHTRNFSSYLFRMVLFAFISEVPFDLVVSNSIHSFQHQNVLFTFSIGLICISCCEKVKQTSISGFIKFLIFAAGAYLAAILHTDYGYLGIAMIFVFYYFRYDRLLMFVFAAVVCFLESYQQNYCGAIMALFFIALYNHKKGKEMPKYFFYIFYPLHLFILYMIVWISSYLSKLK